MSDYDVLCHCAAFVPHLCQRITPGQTRFGTLAHFVGGFYLKLKEIKNINKYTGTRARECAVPFPYRDGGVYGARGLGR